MKRRIFISLLWLLFSTITNVEAAASSSVSLLQDPIARPETIQVLRLGSNPILAASGLYPADASYLEYRQGEYLNQFERLHFDCLHITKNKQYADDFSIPTDTVYASGGMRIFYTSFNAPDFDKKVLRINKVPFDLIITDKLTSKFIDEKSYDERNPSCPKSIERIINLLNPGGFLILTDTSETYNDGYGNRFPKKGAALYCYATQWKEYDRAMDAFIEWEERIKGKSSPEKFEEEKKGFLQEFGNVFSDIEKNGDDIEGIANPEFAQNFFQAFKRCLTDCAALFNLYYCQSIEMINERMTVGIGTENVTEPISTILEEYKSLTSGQDGMQKFFDDIDLDDAYNVFSFVYYRVPDSNRCKVNPFELSLIDPFSGKDRTQINGGPQIKITRFKDVGDFFIFVQKSLEIPENLREIIWYLFTLGNSVDGKKIEDTVKKHINLQEKHSMEELIELLDAHRRSYESYSNPEYKISFPTSIIVVQRLFETGIH